MNDYWEEVLKMISDLDKDKITKEEAGYKKQSPHDEEKCGNCDKLLRKGCETRCSLVEGLIDEEAWCEYWVPED